eukprot:5611875-Pleurochrysis_carterae.AAC.1
MSEAPDNPDSVSPKPSWDASQVNIRPLLEDLFPWLQSKSPSYAPLFERGYALTFQGRVAVTFAEHAEHVFFDLTKKATLSSRLRLSILSSRRLSRLLRTAAQLALPRAHARAQPPRLQSHPPPLTRTGCPVS